VIRVTLSLEGLGVHRGSKFFMIKLQVVRKRLRTISGKGYGSSNWACQTCHTYRTLCISLLSTPSLDGPGQRQEDLLQLVLVLFLPE
jgi:hypothetical protein